MSPQETQLLQKFLDQLIQANGISKDADAQAMIAQAVSRQPDAAYLLVQRALLLEQAVSNAQNQIAQLQTEVAELRAPRTAERGFLDASSNAWGNSASSRPAVPAPMANAAVPVPSYAYAPPAQANMQPGFLGGNAGGMLGTMAATAAGVAAGAFLFQGIGSLMGHHPAGGGQALDSADASAASAASAAPAGSGSGGGLIDNYFTDDTAAQAGAEDAGSDDSDSFDGDDTA